MDKKDRNLIIKIAKKLDSLERAIEGKEDKKTMLETKEFLGTPQTENIPGTVRPDPFIQIMSKFAIKGIKTIPEQNQQQDKLRIFIREFCRNAGIEELQVIYKENTQ